MFSTRNILIALSLLSASTLACGCSSSKTPASRPLVVVNRPAPVPEGVVQYCWEEPIVEYDRVNPGLGAEGRWYHPAYIATREIRAGKWRPCRPLPRETREIGDY